MLPRVLLHVVPAAVRIDAAMHRCARQRRRHRRVQVVDDPAIFRLRNFRNTEPIVSVMPGKRKPSSVMHLSAASRIKRGFPQDDSRPRLRHRRRCNMLDH